MSDYSFFDNLVSNLLAEWSEHRIAAAHSHIANLLII
jgi:hypothetical protein